jgi:hypothetical protein
LLIRIISVTQLEEDNREGTTDPEKDGKFQKNSLSGYSFQDVKRKKWPPDAIGL